MTSTRRRRGCSLAVACPVWCGSALLLLTLCAPTSAQPTDPRSNEIRSTSVNVELLTASEIGFIHAQEWAKVFESLGTSAVFRRGLASDKPEVSERVLGTLRTVTAVGRMTRTGTLEFPERSFSRNDVAALKEWLAELRTYGVQGSPKGKPLWGLSKTQFEDVFSALSVPVKADLANRTLPSAIATLNLPPRFPIRWSTAAEQRFLELPADEKLVRQPVTGFSAGTTLAILLSDRGFGFRPNRTPAATLELLIDLQVVDDPGAQWPVGWPIADQVPALMPGLFAMRNIDLYREPLTNVLQTAAEEAAVPFVIDHTAIAAAKIDLSQVKAEHPIKKTNWSLALRRVLFAARLNREYLQDEAGRGFVWVTPLSRPQRPAADAP